MQTKIRYISFAMFLAVFSFIIVSCISTSGVKDIFSKSAFNIWKKSHSSELIEFNKYLTKENVKDIVPTYQILRTASMAQECAQSAFEIPPKEYWHNIVPTLRFIKDYIIPVVGEVEAVSNYRNPILNDCAKGAKNSAHTQFFALDLIPKSNLTRDELINKVCKIHNEFGEKYNVGLGFYKKTRFHIDTRSYRKWGANGTNGTSPCH